MTSVMSTHIHNTNTYNESCDVSINTNTYPLSVIYIHTQIVFVLSKKKINIGFFMYTIF